MGIIDDLKKYFIDDILESANNRQLAETYINLHKRDEEEENIMTEYKDLSREEAEYGSPAKKESPTKPWLVKVDKPGNNVWSVYLAESSFAAARDFSRDRQLDIEEEVRVVPYMVSYTYKVDLTVKL